MAAVFVQMKQWGHPLVFSIFIINLPLNKHRISMHKYNSAWRPRLAIKSLCVSEPGDRLFFFFFHLRCRKVFCLCRQQLTFRKGWDGTRVVRLKHVSKFKPGNSAAACSASRLLFSFLRKKKKKKWPCWSQYSTCLTKNERHTHEEDEEREVVMAESRGRKDEGMIRNSCCLALHWVLLLGVCGAEVSVTHAYAHLNIDVKMLEQGCWN